MTNVPAPGLQKEKQVPRWNLRRLDSVARRTLGPAIILTLWALSTSLGWVHPSVLPGPGALADAVVHLWKNENLAQHLGVSLGRSLTGGLIGICAGLLLGIFAGLFRIADQLYDTLLQMIRTVPFLALVPLVIVWFGIGEGSKLLLIALASCFPMYINVAAGVRNIDRKTIEAMRIFGLSGGKLIGQVVLPLAMPAILTGLRFSLSVSVLVLVAAEQINAAAGIGYLLSTAQAYQWVDVLLVCIFIYALLGLAADLIVRTLEKYLMPWRPSQTIR